MKRKQRQNVSHRLRVKLKCVYYALYTNFAVPIHIARRPVKSRITDTNRSFGRDQIQW